MEREVEREGKNEFGNIQRAMLMLCSSAGDNSDFCACGRRCHHISAAASSPSQSMPTVRLVVEWSWARGSIHARAREPGPH